MAQALLLNVRHEIYLNSKVIDPETTFLSPF